MTFLALVFLLAATVAIWVLPRPWAPMPLLAGACYMTLGQGIEVAGLNFPIIRLLLLAGVVRVLVRGERPAGGLLGMDKLFLAWGAWALVASAFHESPGATFQFHLGMVYNAFCIYFLTRCFCQTEEDLYRLVRVSAWILVPVAAEMVFEQLTQQNLFAMFGGVPDEPAIRNNRVRSQGPFAHAILAGTVGAVCIPMMVGLWRRDPVSAKVGLAACSLMVLASASSGPLMSVIFGLFALVLWRWRHLTHQMRVAAVVGYILLELTMKAPAYYLIARIDLTGGSSSYHRAALIEAALQNLKDWWWAGTDYTRTSRTITWPRGSVAACRSWGCSSASWDVDFATWARSPGPCGDGTSTANSSPGLSEPGCSPTRLVVSRLRTSINLLCFFI
jgi:hypothetical protein